MAGGWGPAHRWRPQGLCSDHTLSTDPDTRPSALPCRPGCEGKPHQGRRTCLCLCLLTRVTPSRVRKWQERPAARGLAVTLGCSRDEPPARSHPHAAPRAAARCWGDEGAGGAPLGTSQAPQPGGAGPGRQPHQPGSQQLLSNQQHKPRFRSVLGQRPLPTAPWEPGLIKERVLVPTAPQNGTATLPPPLQRGLGRRGTRLFPESRSARPPAVLPGARPRRLGSLWVPLGEGEHLPRSSSLT